MYALNDLYKLYIKNSDNTRFSKRLPDVTKRYTVDIINRAINLCEKWDNFMDIGAFEGHYSIPLLLKFKKGVAVEATPNDSLLTLKKTYPNLTVINDFIEDISFKEKFDFIMMCDLIEHIPLENMNSFLSKISEQQDQGGIVYVLTPNPIFVGPATESELYFSKNGQEHHGHCKHYSRIELLDMFSKHGYDMALEGYEEGPTKHFFKRFIFSISRRDKKYSRNMLYRLISPLFIWIFKIFFWLSEKVIYRSEKRHWVDMLDCMTYTAVFRKR